MNEFGEICPQCKGLNPKPFVNYSWSGEFCNCMTEHPEDNQPNLDMDGYEYDPVAKVWFLKPKRQLWMDDLEMAIDAYRVWLETKHDAEHKIEHGCPGCWVEALEAFDIIFGEEALKDYVPGEGISVLETHERMREKGEL